MDDSGLVRFPGNLDPCAREFFPTNPFGSLLPPPQQQQQVYFPYPPYQQSPHPYCEGVGYPSLPLAPPPLQSPYLPPPSHTPTRALLISMVSPDVSEWLVRRELEVFGDVRRVEMERVREGIVTVHFYDLRHAQAALVKIQEQHMQQQYRLRRHYESSALAQNFLPPPPPPPLARGLIAGRAVWAQFTIPASYGVADGNNQGTLVIFNLDPHVSPSHLKDIFETFGTVKELRETPMKRHQRFVEFYDVRDAAKALSEMNHKEINSKKILIQYSRPGGCGSKPTQNLTAKFHTSRQPSRFFQPPPFQPKAPPRSAAPRCYSSSSSSVTTWGSSKKWNQSKGNPSGGSIQDSMDSLCIISRNGYKKKGTDNSCGGSSSSSSSSSKQYGKTNRRTWKGGNNNNNNNVMKHDPRFLINEDAIMESECRDSRTTVMIKNIPNKYSQKLLLNMLDNHCIHCNEQIAPAATHHHHGGGGGDDPHHLLPKSSYDFVYLPIDFVNKCNVGYGFVNMTSPEAAWRLYKAFHLQTWEAFNSRKICEVTYARIQGIEALKEHFKNSRFPCEADEYMPVVFSPPRDGRILTAPLPIFGCGVNPPPSPSKEGDENLRLLAINGDDGGAGINEDGGGGGGTSNDGGDGNDEGDGN